MISPTQRARTELKKRGWPCAIVEHWNPHARIRQDLFGVFDLVALRPKRDFLFLNDEYPLGESARDISADFTAAILGIQVTSASNRAARREKILASPYLKPWCECGGRVELWTFAKSGARGKPKRWTLTVEQIEPAQAEVAM